MIDINKNNTLKFNLDIRSNNDNLKDLKEYKININDENNENKFSFNLSEESNDELKRFINFLLDNINKYDDLHIEIVETDDYLINKMSNSFKKVWEEEYKKVKEEIDKLGDEKKI